MLYLLRILPEPTTLVSCLLGFPEYRILPDPATLAFKLSRLTTLASPEPLIKTSVLFDFKSEALKSPEPETLTFKLFVEPLRVKSPEPDKVPFTVVEFKFKTISPEPARDTFKLLDVMMSLFHKSPDPESDMAFISLKGMVIFMPLFLLGLILVKSFTLTDKTLFFTSTIMYSNKFSSPSNLICPSWPSTKIKSKEPLHFILS